MAETTATEALPAADEERRFRRGLIGLAALGAISQLLIQTQAFGGNPMVLVPQVDAAVLWDRAGEIAGGDLVDDAPFETAPLMLWWAAAIRAVGGGLAALGALQSILHVATALVLARGARTLASRLEDAFEDDGAARMLPGTVGLLAGALFLLVDEPAATTSRVLAGSLQLFVVALLLEALARIDRAAPPRLVLRAGLLTGLAALAYPPFLGLVPLIAVWLWPRTDGGLRSAGVFVAASAAALAPATVHNLAACGEPIPISAQAGLTFYHGNNPLADGTFAAAGVVNSKETQALDSLTKAREALGKDDAGWSDASDYWFGQGLEWWADAPGEALQVAAVKLWYALSGRHYGDVYQPWMERRDGVASRLWLAPLPIAWLIPVALVALFGLVRRLGVRESFPWLLLSFVPFAVCVVFWYTPRYRLPAVVVIAPLAALALARMARGGRDAATLGVAVVLGIGASIVNGAIGFDEDPQHERRHAARMAGAYGALERHEDGLLYLRKDMQLAPEDPEAASRVVMLLLYLGRDAEAASTIVDAPESVRELPGPRTLLAWTRATSSDPAARDGASALELADRLVTEFGPEPGLFDTRAAARARTGDFEGAAADARAAIEALTVGDPLRTEIQGRLALYESGQPFTQPERLQP